MAKRGQSYPYRVRYLWTPSAAAGTPGQLAVLPAHGHD